MIHLNMRCVMLNLIAHLSLLLKFSLQRYHTHNTVNIFMYITCMYSLIVVPYRLQLLLSIVDL